MSHVCVLMHQKFHDGIRHINSPMEEQIETLTYLVNSTTSFSMT